MSQMSEHRPEPSTTVNAAPEGRIPDAQSQDLQGSIEHFRLPDILQLITHSRKTGTLAIQRDEEIVLIYFDTGRVIYAYGPRATYHIGQILRDRKKITASQLSAAVAEQNRRSDNTRLGAILLETGAIDRADIIEVVTEQIEELLYSLLSWQTGSFKFYENQFPTQEEITVRISTENIILEGLRRLDEMNHLRDTLPSMDSILLIAKSLGGGMTISLNPEEWNLLALIDGRRSIRDIVEISNLSEIETLKKLAALKLAGLVTILSQDEVAAGAEATAAGADQLDVMMTRLAGLLEEFLQGSAAPTPSFSTSAEQGAGARMVGDKKLTAIIAESEAEDSGETLWNELTN